MKKKEPEFVDPRVELVDIKTLQQEILKVWPEWEKRSDELGRMLYWLRAALKDKEPRRKGTGFKKWCDDNGINYDRAKYLADKYEPEEVKQEKEQRQIAKALTRQLQTPRTLQPEKKEISFSTPWEMRLDVWLVARLGDQVIEMETTLAKKLEVADYLAQHFKHKIDQAESNQRCAERMINGGPLARALRIPSSTDQLLLDLWDRKSLLPSGVFPWKSAESEPDNSSADKALRAG
jgi:hypothetical protein